MGHDNKRWIKASFIFIKYHLIQRQLAMEKMLLGVCNHREGNHEPHGTMQAQSELPFLTYITTVKLLARFYVPSSTFLSF